LDLEVDQVKYPGYSAGEVHSGFYEAYSFLQEGLMAVMISMIDTYPNSSILVTGHSLGGAIALLAALDIKTYFEIPPENFTLYTFGQPRVGDKVFSDFVWSQLSSSNYYRVVHYDDMVPHVPPQAGTQYRHAGHEVWYPSRQFDGKFKVCINKAGLPENKSCSSSLWFTTGIAAHRAYLGLLVSGQCNKV
jgi:Lipase (class 3)